MEKILQMTGLWNERKYFIDEIVKFNVRLAKVKLNQVLIKIIVGFRPQITLINRIIQRQNQ